MEDLKLILAALVTLTAVFYKHYLDQREKKTQIAKAFKGEIEALCSILRLRQYSEHFDSIAKDLRNGEPIPQKTLKADLEYLHVYKANAQSIGLLKNDAPRIVASFYIYTTALLEDINAISTGYFDGKDPKNLADFYTEAAEVVRKVLKAGDEASEELNASLKR